jgi:hypothetical protein
MLQPHNWQALFGLIHFAHLFMAILETSKDEGTLCELFENSPAGAPDDEQTLKNIGTFVRPFCDQAVKTLKTTFRNVAISKPMMTTFAALGTMFNSSLNKKQMENLWWSNRKSNPVLTIEDVPSLLAIKNLALGSVDDVAHTNRL